MPQPELQSPLGRVRAGAIILLATVLVGTLGFHFIAEYEWIESLWMVVITISTVGYGEQSQSAAAVQLLSMLVIVLGLSSAVFTFSGFFQIVLEGELERTLGVRRMSRQIDKLRNHVIICGMGRSGRSLAHELEHRGREFVAIENDDAKIAEAHTLGFPTVAGDATDELVLAQAGLKRAHTLVSALPSDADNVFITLTAREVNPELLIIASAELESTAKKLHQAGAQKVVMPTRISALQMSRMILHPSTADLMELLAESSYLDLESDELDVNKHQALVGMSVRETEAHRKHKLLVVAVRRGDGEMIFNPEAEYVFAPGDIVIMLGHREHIDRFRSQYIG